MDFHSYIEQKNRMLDILSKQLVRGNTLHAVFDKLIFSDVQVGDEDDISNSYVIARPDRTKGSLFTGETRLNFDRVVLDSTTPLNSALLLENKALFLQHLEENNVSLQAWCDLLNEAGELSLQPEVDLISVSVVPDSIKRKNGEIYAFFMRFEMHPNSLYTVGSLDINPFAPIQYELDQTRHLIYLVRNNSTIEAYKDNGEVYQNFDFLSNAIEVDYIRIESITTLPDQTLSLDGSFRLFFKESTDEGEVAHDIDCQNITIDQYGMIIGYRPDYLAGHYPMINTLHNPNALQKLYHTPMHFSMNVGIFVDTASAGESLYTTTFRDYSNHSPIFAVDKYNRLYAACSYFNYTDDGYYHHRLVLSRYHEGELDETYTPFMIERFDLSDPVEARVEFAGLCVDDTDGIVTVVFSQSQHLIHYQRNGNPLITDNRPLTINPVYSFNSEGLEIPLRNQRLDNIGSLFYGVERANDLLIGDSLINPLSTGLLFGLFYKVYPKNGYLGYYPVRFSKTGEPIIDEKTITNYPWIRSIYHARKLGDKILAICTIDGDAIYQDKLGVLIISDDYPIYLQHGILTKEDTPLLTTVEVQ